MKSFDPSQFTTTDPKPLPVLLLLDVSGSMAGAKIAALNRAVRDMLGAFQGESPSNGQVVVSIITFGGVSSLHLPITPASEVSWTDMTADGETPLGGALCLAKKLVEDKGTIPSRAYRPTAVLVSDGQPTDDWRGPLDDFVNRGRSSKCDRMAMAIGADADETVLSAFIAGTPHPLYRAANASQLHEFFRRVTMSVSMRASSKTPNEVPAGINLIPVEGGPFSKAPVSAPGASSGTASEDGYW